MKRKHKREAALCFSLISWYYTSRRNIQRQIWPNMGADMSAAQEFTTPIEGEIKLATRIAKIYQLQETLPTHEVLHISEVRHWLQSLMRLRWYGFLKDITYELIKYGCGFLLSFNDYQQANLWVQFFVSDEDEDVVLGQMKFLSGCDLSPETLCAILEAAERMSESMVDGLLDRLTWGGVGGMYLVEKIVNDEWWVTFVPPSEPFTDKDDWNSTPIYKIVV